MGCDVYESTWKMAMNIIHTTFLEANRSRSSVLCIKPRERIHTSDEKRKDRRLRPGFPASIIIANLCREVLTA